MTFQVAKDAIDFFIGQQGNLLKRDFVILDFIGGEPLLEIDLIDEIVDYFKYITFKNDNRWFGRYRISISTNGILYSSQKVQHFIAKNKNNLSIGISIDGTKEKHDLQRVYMDGKGSYDDVIKNVKLWLKQYPDASTKVTISHDDLVFVKDSIIHLWNLGIKNVPANTIFEDVWEEGDPYIFEEQLKQLADYIIDNKLWDKVNTTLFSENLGFKQVEDEINKNFCGAGKTFAIDSKGNIYPCVRYMKYSLENKREICLGNIYKGIDSEKIRPFKILTAKLQSPQECIDCPVSSGCAYCQAQNYDSSSMNTNFERSLASCEMHKSRVRANNYFWAKLYNLYDINRFEDSNFKRSFDRILYIMMGSDSINICANYISNRNKEIKISTENFIKAIEYAERNLYQPYIIHRVDINQEEDILNDKKILQKMEGAELKHIVYYSHENIELLLRKFKLKDVFPIFNSQNICKINQDQSNNCILIVKREELQYISRWIIELKKYYQRINLKCEILNSEDLDIYERQLNKVKDEIVSAYKSGNYIEVSVLTDRLFIDSMVDNCNAGEKNMTYAPDGNIYICPAFYYNENFKDMYVDKEINMTLLEKAPTCKICDAYQCERCVYLNKTRTYEFNIPSTMQCFKAHRERKITLKLKEELEKMNIISGIKNMKDISYEEPFSKLLEDWSLID